MQVRIDPRGDKPVYGQIVEQIRIAIASGEIVAGAKLPTVRSLANDLGVNINTVLRAYGELERAGVVTTRPGLGTFIAKVEDDRLEAEREARLVGLLGKAVLEALSLGYSIEHIETSLALSLARWRSGTDSSPAAGADLPGDTIVAMGSHDLVLDMLAGQLRRIVPPIKMTSLHVGSLGGLIAIARGEAHLAGCHLLDQESGLYNLPYVKRVLPGLPLVLVNLVQREQGLMVPRGNPKKIHGIADLARPDVTFINRQWGSGTRVLLEYELQQAGIALEQIHGHEREVKTHLAVAAVVASQAADVGMGILSAARALDLDFIPLSREQYDLVVPKVHYHSDLLRPLFEIIHDRSFQHMVEEMGGYDISQSGQIVAAI